MTETDTDRLTQIGQVMALGAPQSRALGLEFVSAGRGEAVLRCPYRPELIGDVETGVIAGGVVTTLLDHTCSLAVITALDSYRSNATLDLHIDYMRPAEPGLAISAHAHCYKITRSIAFVRATAYDRDPDDPLASVQATFILTTPRTGRSARRDEAT